MRRMKPAAERFWSKVVQSGDCWEWAGSQRKGYGVFWDGAPVQAHRWAYEHMAAPIPGGLYLDHLCRNRACVNPDHLDPVPNRVNLLRGDTIGARNANKTHCRGGHEFTPSNTLIRADGSRQCRTCRRERQKASGRGVIAESP